MADSNPNRGRLYPVVWRITCAICEQNWSVHTETEESATAYFRRYEWNDVSERGVNWICRDCAAEAQHPPKDQP